MTSEPKWTPGPWFANGAAVMVDTREQVCCGRRQDECCGEPDVKGGCEIIAECGELDACLIAAAPELYEALDALVSQSGWHGRGEREHEIFYCEMCGESHEAFDEIPHGPNCFVGRARAALKKARGE